MKILLPIFALILPWLIAAQRCPMEIWVFRSASECFAAFQNPSAIGQLYADNTCHSSKLLFTADGNAEALLPGTYSLHCLQGGGQRIEFSYSAGVSTDCNASWSELYSQELDKPAALYSLAKSPPVYDVYDPQNKDTAVSHNCTTLSAGQGEFELTFLVFGNCSDPSCFNQAPNPTLINDIHAPRTSEPSAKSPTTSPSNVVKQHPTANAVSGSETKSDHPALIASTVLVLGLALCACWTVLLLHRKRVSAQSCDLKETVTSEGKEPSGDIIGANSSPRTISIPHDIDDLSTLESPSDCCLGNDQQAINSFNAPPYFLESDGSVYTSDNEQLYETGSLTSLFPDDETTPDIPDDCETSPGRRFQVVAPPGDLGIVIDSTKEGISEVYSMRGNSQLMGQVRVGDQLVAVDGIDVAGANHAELLRLIDLRSDASRRLTFFRSLRMDEWGVLGP